MDPMGAAPLLIMLAAVGVDYGWQPDGTTSSRGDNVQYIIQIPPHQLDQIKSIGEITSAIDPSIQGRVASIVVRVGTEPLPRIAGRATSTPTVAQAGGMTGENDDDAQVPIPEIKSSAEAIAAKSASRASTPGSEAMMKPDPQAGGFTLPDSLSNPVRTNPSVSTDPAATGRDNRWDDIRGRSATTVPTPTMASGFPAGTSSTSNMVSGSGAQGPSTEPVDPAARSTSWPGFVGPPVPANLNSGSTSTPLNITSTPRPATTPSDPNWSGYGTTPNFGTLPPGMNTGQPAAVSSPLTTGTIGYSQNASTTGDLLSRQAAELQRTAAAQLEATANAAQTFSRDAAGNLLDRLGRPIDSLGRLIDPESGNLVDAAGNWIDQYGRKIDRFGRPLPGETATTSAQNPGATLQPPLLPSQRNDSPYYGQTATNQPVYGNPATGQNANVNGYPAANGYTNPNYANTGQSGGINPSTGFGQGGLANDPRMNQWQGGSGQVNTGQLNTGQLNTGQLNTGQSYSRQPDPVYSRGSSTGLAEDNLRSPSDSRLTLNPTATSDLRGQELLAEREAAFARQSLSIPGRTKSVAAQPFFNFVLLISLVGNAYLIFETGNLRRKFRNMIANVRATKISPQPAG